MNLDLILLSLALAADASIVGFGYGLLSNGKGNAYRAREGLILGSLFGLFQFVMSYLGSLAGHYLTFSHLGSLSQWLIVGIFVLLGIKMIKESFDHDEKVLSMHWSVLLSIAFVTSVDALGAGLSFGTLPEAHFDCLIIGLLTFLSSVLAYSLSSVLKHLPEAWTLRLAGVLMFFLAFKSIL
ncbi:MAG: manganese efflux pump [Bacteriovoracaceae bacterium]